MSSTRIRVKWKGAVLNFDREYINGPIDLKNKILIVETSVGSFLPRYINEAKEACFYQCVDIPSDIKIYPFGCSPTTRMVRQSHIEEMLCIINGVLYFNIGFRLVELYVGGKGGDNNVIIV